MHIDTFVRGKGKFFNTQYVASEEKITRKYPLILTTGRILSQYNAGAQTRRTHNDQCHRETKLGFHPNGAKSRGMGPSDWVGISGRPGRAVRRAVVTERIQP